MDWVHCNFCFIQPNKDKRFSLTNCGHLFCSSCLEKGTQGQCLTCKAPCTTIGLSAKMRPDIEQYFSDALDVLKKQQKTIIQILEFQKKHRDRYVAHLKEDTLGDISKRHQQLLERTSQLERENQMLRSQMVKLGAVEKENQMLRTELQRVTGRTVGVSMSSGMIPSQSPISSARPGGPGPPLPSMRTPSQPQHAPMPATVQRTILRKDSVSPCTPSGPKRILVRTPPINGKMGYIPSPSGRQPSSQGMHQNIPPTGSRPSSRSVTTPSPSMSQSPMSFSPIGSSGSVHRPMSGSQSQQGHYYTPSLMAQQTPVGRDGYKQPTSSAVQFGRPRTPR